MTFRAFTRAACALLFASTVAVIAVSGCSSSSSPAAAAPKCDPAKCLAGNQCIDDGSGNGPACHLVCTSQASCPANYHCTVDATGSVDFCAPDNNTITPGPKQWGAPCNPSGGILNNPDCDVAQHFSCYATSPSDGAAYCTQYGCATDNDCKGGWWCATVNRSPNAQSGTYSVGVTNTVCKPRAYCAPCNADIDCEGSGGAPEHCIADAKGTHYCAPECMNLALPDGGVQPNTGDTSCNNEAHCIDLSQRAPCGKGTCVCAARAHLCVGDGKLCSPCQSDKDCPDGQCIKADYSTEHFCTVKSGVACAVDMTTGKVASQCPSMDEAKSGVGCIPPPPAGQPPLPDVQVSQCVGLRTFGTDQNTGDIIHVLGCYTPDR